MACFENPVGLVAFSGSLSHGQWRQIFLPSQRNGINPSCANTLDALDGIIHFLSDGFADDQV